ncbi:MAG: STAS domain-containing protein [Bacteroidia bacterium]|nr:STAS domain-containing protein [Bacteroidia bacterium]
MKYTIENKNKIIIINLEGNLINEYENKGLLDEVDELISNKISFFIIDLSKLENLNSSGLGVLITILTKSRKANGETYITNVSEKIKQLLIITKLNSVFNFAENIEDAEKQLTNTV